jgi:hypothetical protein
VYFEWASEWMNVEWLSDWFQRQFEFCLKFELCVSSKVLATIKISMFAFCIKPCILVGSYKNFWRTYRLNLQPWSFTYVGTEMLGVPNRNAETIYWRSVIDIMIIFVSPKYVNSVCWPTRWSIWVCEILIECGRVSKWMCERMGSRVNKYVIYWLHAWVSNTN